MSKRCTGVLFCAIATLFFSVATANAQDLPTTDPQTVVAPAVPPPDPAIAPSLPPADAATIPAADVATGSGEPQVAPTAPDPAAPPPDAAVTAVVVAPSAPPADTATTPSTAAPIVPPAGPASGSSASESTAPAAQTPTAATGSETSAPSVDDPAAQPSSSDPTQPSPDPTTTETAAEPPAPTSPPADTTSGDPSDTPPDPAADPLPTDPPATDPPVEPPIEPIVAPPVPPPGARFIIRTRASVMDAVLGRHGLTALAVVHDDASLTVSDPERILLIAGPPGMPAKDLDEEMDADRDITGCEPDRGMLVPELAGANVAPSVSALQQSLSTRTVTTYYGVPAPNTYASQPAAALIRLRDIHDFFSGGGIVAVIDTGVDATHPLLAGSVLPGFDFTRDQAGTATDVLDLDQSTAAILEQSTAAILEANKVVVVNQSTAAILEQSTAAILEGLPALPAAFGHGTMVAGLVHLAAPTASILPLKAFGADGTSTIASVVRAIYYAVDHGAKVINMSFSVSESSPELMKAINYATSRRVTCVAAAGNLGRETVVYPAGYRNVIAVASTTNSDRRSVFSNYGDSVVTLAAPGEGLTTTYPGGHFASVSGTSFSTALVSGAVALMLQPTPTLTPADALDNLSHAERLSQRLGYGRLDLMKSAIRER